MSYGVYAWELPATRPTVTNKLHCQTTGFRRKYSLGLQMFLRFCEEFSLLRHDECRALYDDCWKALLSIAAEQSSLQSTEELARRFLELVEAAASAGLGHFLDVDGNPPEAKLHLGWKESRDPTEPALPQGKLLGWRSENELLLHPDVAFAVACEMGRQLGTPIVTSKESVWKRLAGQCLIVRSDGRNLVKRQVQGHRKRVLIVPLSSFMGLSELVAGPQVNLNIQANNSLHAQEQTKSGTQVIAPTNNQYRKKG